MLFAPPRVDRLLRRRLAGLATSAALHAAAILLATWQGPQADPGVLDASTAPAAASPLTVAVVERPAADDASTVVRRPALELAGIVVDLDKLIGKPVDLFPFVLLDLDALSPYAGTPSQPRRLTYPVGDGTGRRARAPLELSDRALQALVDRAWSRRERWRPFLPIVGLVDVHDGDTGRMADVLRAYTDQNLLQPYYDGDTLDARYWTMLGLAADHSRFLDRVTRYLREQPGTKASTELLFLLDELVQGSLDTLLMVVASDPAAALRRTAAEQPLAYARAEVVFAQTRDWLGAIGVGTPDAIRRRLDAVRLGILRAIVAQAPAGYRVSDARYLAGVIHFQRRERDEAFAEWSRAAPGPDDLYRTAIDEIHAALALPAERRVPAIVAALGAEHGRWLTFSEQRLRRFGYDAEKF
jgi:hypothetical protein